MSADEMSIYSFFRDEIVREDEINHNRMVTSLTFQGFLLGAMGFLVSGAWPAATSSITPFREWVIGGIGLIGFLVSISSAIGIQASRMSIADTKKIYRIITDEEMTNDRLSLKFERLKIDTRLPKIHGRGIAFGMGNVYARSMPLWFSILWVAYLIAYSKFMKPDIFEYTVWIIPGIGIASYMSLGVLDLLGSPKTYVNDKNPSQNAATANVANLPSNIDASPPA
jgi:hypothetical protein